MQTTKSQWLAHSRYGESKVLREVKLLRRMDVLGKLLIYGMEYSELSQIVFCPATILQVSMAWHELIRPAQQAKTSIFALRCDTKQRLESLI